MKILCKYEKKKNKRIFHLFMVLEIHVLCATLGNEPVDHESAVTSTLKH